MVALLNDVVFAARGPEDFEEKSTRAAGGRIGEFKAMRVSPASPAARRAVAPSDVIEVAVFLAIDRSFVGFDAASEPLELLVRDGCPSIIYLPELRHDLTELNSKNVKSRCFEDRA